MNREEELEEERDALRRELIGTQELLAFVLQQTGPVVVDKETIKKGLPKDAVISVDDQLHESAFIFSLVMPE
jgi:hypothetical protein